ncbi:MAG TPA: hypothetical protein DCX03_11110, partial [Bacteroidales bacterium]|nr:hypothetical protein [Bacteroidales bacterium]
MKADVFTYFRSIVDRFFEQFSDRCFIDERPPQNAEYIEQAAIEMEVMFGDSNKAVSAYGAIDLYSDSILGVAPKGFDIQMLLDPFE